MNKLSKLLMTISFLVPTTTAFAGIKRPFKNDDSFFVQHTNQSEIRIMSMNTHNLYDTEHDEGYFDYTFLPLSHPDKLAKCETVSSGYYRSLCSNLDWTPQRLSKKLSQISKVLRHHGSLPEILALQEVENANVLQMLADRLGYDRFVITDQKSRRGQDVALLWDESKLEFVEQKEIPAPLRDPLRVQLRIRGTRHRIYIYVNHWPAQSAPESWRVESAKAVRDDIDSLLQEDPEARIVMVGDFNTTYTEEEIVFGDQILDPAWEHQLVEVHDLSRKYFPQFKEYFPDGTYFRGLELNSWNRFDRIFVSQNLIDGSLRAMINSYRIIYSRMITGTALVDDEDSRDQIEVRYPLGYNFLEDEGQPLGYTDHLPVSVNLKY